MKKTSIQHFQLVWVKCYSSKLMCRVAAIKTISNCLIKSIQFLRDSFMFETVNSPVCFFDKHVLEECSIFRSWTGYWEAVKEAKSGYRQILVYNPMNRSLWKTSILGYVMNCFVGLGSIFLPQDNCFNRINILDITNCAWSSIIIWYLRTVHTVFMQLIDSRPVSVRKFLQETFCSIFLFL